MCLGDQVNQPVKWASSVRCWGICMGAPMAHGMPIPQQHTPLAKCTGWFTWSPRHTWRVLGGPWTSWSSLLKAETLVNHIRLHRYTVYGIGL